MVDRGPALGAFPCGYGSVTGQGGAVVAADAILEAERGLGKGCVGWAAFGHLVAAGCLLKINFYPNRSSTGSPGLTWSENPSGPKRWRPVVEPRQGLLDPPAAALGRCRRARLLVEHF